jgi:glycosyltransferase involved in cell wall biosynthesis
MECCPIKTRGCLGRQLGEGIPRGHGFTGPRSARACLEPGVPIDPKHRYNLQRRHGARTTKPLMYRSTTDEFRNELLAHGPLRHAAQVRPSRMEAREPRVALCAAGEIWGGVEQFIETASEELRRRGVGFVVLLLNEGLLAKRLRESALPVEVVRTVGKYDPTGAFRIGRALRRHRIRIVHVHGYKASLLGGIAAKLNGMRLVKTEHGSLEPFSGWARLKMKVNLWLDEAFSKRFLDAIIFVSRDIQQNLASRYRRIPQTVIYNAIQRIDDSGDPASTPPLQPEGAFRIGIVGRLKPIKGHEVLLRAFSQLAHRSELRLYIFGEGPTEPTLRRLCRESGHEDRVQFMGFRENIHGYMRQLDVMAMPSFHEGIPYAALEAMSLRVPLVASRVGGLREILEHEVDALLVPPGDAEALARAIERLATDPDLRSRLVRSARNKVQDQFQASPMVDRYLAVYRRAVARA